MARIKGSKKTGGRKKGSLNKSTAAVEQLIAESGFNPILAMIKIAKDPKATIDVRLRAAMGVAEYVYPKRRAIEVAPQNGPKTPDLVINVHTNGSDDTPK